MNERVRCNRFDDEGGRAEKGSLLDEHIAACPACAEKRRGNEAIISMLSQMTQINLKSPCAPLPGWEARLDARLDRAFPPPENRRGLAIPMADWESMPDKVDLSPYIHTVGKATLAMVAAVVLTAVGIVVWSIREGSHNAAPNQDATGRRPENTSVTMMAPSPPTTAVLPKPEPPKPEPPKPEPPKPEPPKPGPPKPVAANVLAPMPVRDETYAKIDETRFAAAKVVAGQCLDRLGFGDDRYDLRGKSVHFEIKVSINATGQARARLLEGTLTPEDPDVRHCANRAVARLESTLFAPVLEERTRSRSLIYSGQIGPRRE